MATHGVSQAPGGREGEEQSPDKDHHADVLRVRDAILAERPACTSGRREKEQVREEKCFKRIQAACGATWHSLMRMLRRQVCRRCALPAPVVAPRQLVADCAHAHVPRLSAHTIKNGPAHTVSHTAMWPHGRAGQATARLSSRCVGGGGGARCVVLAGGRVRAAVYSTSIAALSSSHWAP